MEEHTERMSSSDEEIVLLIPALRAFARTFYRTPNDADDLVQATLMRAIASIHQYHDGTSMKSWLFVPRQRLCPRFEVEI